MTTQNKPGETLTSWRMTTAPRAEELNLPVEDYRMHLQLIEQVAKIGVYLDSQQEVQHRFKPGAGG